MVNNRQSRITVGAQTDVASINQATNELAKISASYKEVAKAAASVGLSVEDFAARTGVAIQGATAQTKILADTQIIAANQSAAAQAQVTNAFAQTSVAVKNVIRDIGDLGRDIQLIPEPSLGSIVPGLGEAGRGRGVGGTISRVSRSLFNLPDVQLTPGISTTVISRLGIAAGAGAEAVGLTTAGLAAFGVVAAAVVIPIALVASALQKSEEAAKKYAAEQLKIAQLLGSGATTADIQARIDALESEREAIREGQVELDTLRTYIQGAFALPESAVIKQDLIDSAFKDLSDATNGQITDLHGLTTALNSSQERVIAIGGELFTLRKAMDSTEVAANNLRLAEEALAQIRKDAANAIRSELDDEAAFRLHAADLRRSGTADAVRDEIQANQDRVAMIDNFLIPALTKAGISTLDLVLEGNKLEAQNRLLQASVLPLLDSREREAAAIGVQLGAIENSITRQIELADLLRNATVEQVADRLHSIEDERAALVGVLPELERLAATSVVAKQQLEEARGRLGDLNSDYFTFITQVLPSAMRRAQDDLAADQADLRAKSQVKLNEIEANRLEADAKALDARNDAYQSAEEKRGEALNKLAEDQAAARAKIERKSGVDIANAVYRRDALAAYLAQQAKQEQLQDLKEQGEQRAQELDKQSAKERQQADRNFDKALRSAQDAADKSARLERDRATRELNERINAYNAQIALLDTFNVQGTQQISQFVNNALNALRNLANGVGSLLSGATGGSGGVGGAVGGVISTPGIPTGLPPGWVPFPPITGTAARGVGGAVGGLLLANVPPYATSGGVIGSSDVSGGMPARGTLPNRLQRAPSVYDTPRLLAGGGSKQAVTFNISGSKQDARAIARQIEPLIRSLARDEVVEVSKSIRGGRG